MLSRFSKKLGQSNSVIIFLRRCKATTEISEDKKFLETDLATAKPFSEIPGDRRLPFIGTAWTFFPIIGKYDLLHIDKADMDRCKKYGKIARDDIPSIKIVHLYDPDDFEKVFRYEGRYPTRLPFQTIEAYRKRNRHLYETGGLLVDAGTEWYNLRSKSQKHMLRPASVQYYLPGMDDVSCEMLQRMEYLMDANCEIPDFVSELYKWALESIGLVALDAKLGCLQKNLTDSSESMRMIRAVNAIFKIMGFLEFSSLKFWKYFPTPNSLRFFKPMNYFASVSQKYIGEALDRLKNTSFEEKEITFLENLLVTEKMDMSSVNTMITDMLLAGIDTTSHTIAFALYNLAKNPEAQENLRKEIRNIFPDPTARMTSSVLNECRYLKACLKESMRLIPTIPGTTRILQEDIVLSGYRIPAGTAIILESMKILSDAQKELDVQFNV